jgi:hypothetical protein
LIRRVAWGIKSCFAAKVRAEEEAKAKAEAEALMEQRAHDGTMTDDELDAYFDAQEAKLAAQEAEMLGSRRRSLDPFDADAATGAAEATGALPHALSEDEAGLCADWPSNAVAAQAAEEAPAEDPRSRERRRSLDPFEAAAKLKASGLAAVAIGVSEPEPEPEPGPEVDPRAAGHTSQHSLRDSTRRACRPQWRRSERLQRAGWKCGWPASGWSAAGSVALSLCTTAHPLYTGCTSIFGASVPETTVRPDPRWHC